MTRRNRGLIIIEEVYGVVVITRMAERSNAIHYDHILHRGGGSNPAKSYFLKTFFRVCMAVVWCWLQHKQEASRRSTKMTY